MQTVRDLYRFGLKSALLMVSDRIQRQAAPIIIGHALGPSAVVFYAIPKRLVDYAKNLVVAMCAPLMPYFAALDAGTQRDRRAREWLLLSRAVAFVTVPGAILSIGFGESFLRIWVGEPYASRGRWVILAFGLSFSVSGFFSNAGRVLIGSDRHGKAAKRLFLVSLGSIGASVGAAGLVGVAGPAWVIAVADLVSCGVCWREASLYLGVGLREHLVSTLGRVAGPGILLIAGVLVTRSLVSLRAYASLVAGVVCCAAVYFGAVWVVGLSAAERRSVLVIWRQGWVRRRGSDGVPGGGGQ